MKQSRRVAWIGGLVLMVGLVLALFRPSPHKPSPGAGAEKIYAPLLAPTDQTPVGVVAVTIGSAPGSKPVDDPLNLSCMPRDSEIPVSDLDAVIAAHIEKWRTHALLLERAATTAEHWLAAALYGDRWSDPEPRGRRIGAALDLNPDHPLALWAAFVHCEQWRQDKICARHRPAERLADLETDNSEYWAVIAARRSRDGDREGVLDAMQRAAGAPRTSWYSGEFMALAVRTAPTANTSQERWIESVGLAINPYPFQHRALIRLCSDDNSDTRLRDPCIRYGERLEQQGRTILATKLGLGLQAAMLKQPADTAALDDVKTRRANYDNKLHHKAGFVPADERWFGEEVLNEYLQILQVEGEVQATTRLAERIEAYERRVRSGEIEHPCPEKRP